jgi:hypothetical protein
MGILLNRFGIEVDQSFKAPIAITRTRDITEASIDRINTTEAFQQRNKINTEVSKC